jgi:hypothetical protein
MPLYIKLDFSSTGQLAAWVNTDNVWGIGRDAEVTATTAALCLRRLADKLGSLENAGRINK